MPSEDDEIRDFLERRRADYAERAAKLERELEEARAKIRDLDAALAAIGGSTSERKRAGEIPRMTIKEGVLKVLGQVKPRGLSAISILERLRTDLNMGYPRTSLSPQLSRLKAEGKVRLEGGLWFLAETQNGPGAKAPEPS